MGGSTGSCLLSEEPLGMVGRAGRSRKTCKSGLQEVFQRVPRPGRLNPRAVPPSLSLSLPLPNIGCLLVNAAHCQASSLVCCAVP